MKGALKRYPTTKAILDGKVSSPLMRIEWSEVEPIHDAFKPKVR